MKETSFINQNKKKWARFEKLSGQKNNDPDEVAQLFTEITEDLSYARTFYPRRSVRVYLNQLAQGVFTSLYKQRKQPLGSFVNFWKVSLPLELYRARVNLLMSFLFFGLAILVGAVSQHYDQNFVDLILGEGYVTATEERIARGNPMGVYGESPQASMFLRITMNNIMVAFFTFALGMFATIGTYLMLLSNGIMLGSFQWWFYAKGLLLTSFLAVWIHGAFEISSIIIAGGAGITVGNGILFPRSYSRQQSLIFSAKRGLMIMLSLVPFFIIAGFLESYVTRYYNVMPDWTKWLIILSSFGLIIGYYVIYPFRVAKRYPDEIKVKEIPRYTPDRTIEWNKIRKVSEVFTDTFYLFMKNFSIIFRIFVNCILPLCLILLGVIFSFDFFALDYRLDMLELWGTIFGEGRFFTWYKFLGWSFILSMLFCAVFYSIKKDEDEPLFTGYLKFLLYHGFWMYLFSLGVFGLLIWAPGGLLFLCLFITPFIGMIPSLIVFEKKNFFTAFGKSFSLGKGAYGDSLGAFAIFVVISLIFLMALNNPLDGIFGEFDVVSMFQNITEYLTITVFDGYAAIISFVTALIYIIFMFFMISIYALSFSFSYYSSNEMRSAKGLYERLEHFGKRNKTFETEEDFD